MDDADDFIRLKQSASYEKRRRWAGDEFGSKNGACVSLSNGASGLINGVDEVLCPSVEVLASEEASDSRSRARNDSDSDGLVSGALEDNDVVVHVLGCAYIL